jgi:hypothetical protein
VDTVSEDNLAEALMTEIDSLNKKGLKSR